MNIRRAWAAAVGTSTVFVLIGGSAFGQLSKETMTCIDQYNNKTRLVSQTAGMDYRKCIKDAGKGSVSNPENCVATDEPGKVAGKTAKVNDLFVAGGKCTGAEPIQQGAATGNQAHIEGAKNLAHDLFGDPITTNIVSLDKQERKCADKAILRAVQAFTENVKVFRKCKKDGMKAGTVTGSPSLEAACMTPAIPDPKGKITKRFGKIAADVTKNCATTVGSLPTLFPGLDASCHAGDSSLASCIEQRVACRVCETLNAADGMDRDCDDFDGLPDGTCGISLHSCALDSGSQFAMHIAALPAPLLLGLSGTLELGSSGSAADCRIQSLGPVTVPGFGVLCFAPSDSCSDGLRDCDGGLPLGAIVASDGNAGPCSNDAGCEAIAAALCSSPYEVGTAGCTGHCSGDGSTHCTNDSQCLPANGDCHGPDGLLSSQRDICQVSCVHKTAWGASDPGDLQCHLGTKLRIEAAAPCDGADVTVDLPDLCIPMSTQRVSSAITDANFISASTVPPAPNTNELSGVPVSCTDLDAGMTSGAEIVGAYNFFGSALGDLAVGIRAICQ